MLVWGACAAVLIGVPWGLKLASAPAMGEPCGGGFDCAALDGRCVQGEQGKFCTRVCTSDEQCPSEGHCGVPVHDRWALWFSASVMSERVCVPGPRPEVRVDGVPMPKAVPVPKTVPMPGKSARPTTPLEPR